MPDTLYMSKQYRQERKRTSLPTTVLQKALAGLPQAEKRLIEHNCSMLEDAIRTRRKKDGQSARAMFGRKASLELLAKLGMLLLAHEQAEPDASSFSLRKPYVIDRLFNNVD